MQAFTRIKFRSMGAEPDDDDSRGNQRIAREDLVAVRPSEAMLKVPDQSDRSSWLLYPFLMMNSPDMTPTWNGCSVPTWWDVLKKARGKSSEASKLQEAVRPTYPEGTSFNFEDGRLKRWCPFLIPLKYDMTSYVSFPGGLRSYQVEFALLC